MRRFNEPPITLAAPRDHRIGNHERGRFNQPAAADFLAKVGRDYQHVDPSLAQHAADRAREMGEGGAA